MLSTLLSIHQPDYSKYAAWATLAVLAIACVQVFKGFTASALLKLYEIFIQKNGVA